MNAPSNIILRQSKKLHNFKKKFINPPSKEIIILE